MNGKIPLDQKPRGNLVMCERNCLRVKNPCFMKECIFQVKKSCVVGGNFCKIHLLTLLYKIVEKYILDDGGIYDLR